MKKIFLFLSLLSLIILAFTNNLVNADNPPPPPPPPPSVKELSFVLDTCGNDTFVSVGISDNQCNFTNVLHDPRALSCIFDNNQWEITLAGCEHHCVYQWKFDTDKPQSDIQAQYNCQSTTGDKPDTPVTYLAGPPSTYFLNVNSLSNSSVPLWFRHAIVAAPNRCSIIELPSNGYGTECQCDSSGCAVTLMATAKFSMSLDKDNPSIPDRVNFIDSENKETIIGAPLLYETQAPKIYNFRHNRTCDTFFVPVIVGEKYCDNVLPKGTCVCQNGVCTVSMDGCDKGCTNTWSFDIDDPKDVNVTYKCDDGRSGSDVDPLAHYLDFSDDNTAFNPSEMVLLCVMGVHIETGQVMLPSANMSECIDAYYPNRDMTYAPFSEQVVIGVNKDAYSCPNLSRKAAGLCESYLNFISNGENMYFGYRDALLDIGGKFVGIIDDLTVNEASKAYDKKLNKEGILVLLGDALGLPGGSGQGIAKNVFKKDTYIGVFPIIAGAIDIIYLMTDGGDPPSDLVSPVSYVELENLFSGTETYLSNAINLSLKSMDNLTNTVSTGVNELLNNFADFDVNKQDQDDIREAYKPIISAKVTSMILTTNGVKICSNNNGRMDADGACEYEDPACRGCQRCNPDKALRCGVAVTKYGQSVTDHTFSVVGDTSTHVHISDIVCLMADANIGCDQFQRIGVDGVNLIDACTQANGWSVPINQECSPSDFDCESRSDYNVCWDVVAGENSK